MGGRMTDPRQWAFKLDMNHNGSFTITDLWAWFKWLYFYPGDLIIKITISKIPAFAHFFELTQNSYGGIFSGIVSFIIWFLLLILGSFIESKM